MTKKNIVDRTLDEIEDILKVTINSVPPAKKAQFLDNMNKGLGELIASNYTKMRLGHKKVPSIPKWMYRQTVDKLENGTNIVQRTNPNVMYISYFDHFGRPNIIPRRPGDKDKWGWVSNPYFLSCEALETMIEEMKKFGIGFDIVGESNYLPGRSFQIRFRKTKQA